MNKYFYIVFTSILIVIFSVGFYAYKTINTKNQIKVDNTNSSSNNSLEGKKFVWLKSELSLNNEVITPINKDSYFISFEDDNKLRIGTDCNSGFGEYEIKDNKINFGNITSTEKYCPDSQEGIFYNELISAESFELQSDGNLIIDIKIGKLYLKEVNSIEQVNGAITSKNPLIGKEYKWLRTELNNNKIILPKVQGKFSLTFSEDLKFSVQTDCNSNGGMYSFEESKLSFKDIVATRMYCENSQEEVFIRDLQKTSSYEILLDETLILNFSDNSGRIYLR